MDLKFCPNGSFTLVMLFLAKTSATVTEYVLALATLGGATRNINNPICVALPKVSKARTMVSVACRCHWHYGNKLHQCKHSLKQGKSAYS
jgi:hypothetical protein